MIKHIPHASTYTPEWVVFNGEPIDLSDKGVLEIFGDGLIFPISRLVCDVERFEVDPMDKVGMGICYTHNANLEPMRTVSEKEREYIVGEFYNTHHRQLELMVERELDIYDEAVIIDCHTYRKEPWPYEDSSLYRPEVCVGFDEVSWVSEYITSNLNFELGINTPFNGAIKPLKYINDDRVKSVMIEVRQDVDIDTARKGIGKCLREIEKRQLVKAVR